MSEVLADIDRIAELARLRLSEAERRELAAQLERILAYVRQLADVDVRDVPPTSHVLDRADVDRADEPRPSLPRERVLEGAPEVEDDHFVVPGVLPL